MKKNTISIIVLLGFIVAGALFLRGRTDELAKILEVDLIYVIPISMAMITRSLLNGHKLKLLGQVYGLKLKLQECWGLQVVTLFGNYITALKGGDSARAVYLKKKHKFPYTYSVGLTGMSYLFDLMISSLLGVIFSFLLPISNEVKYTVLSIFAIGFTSSFLLLFFLPVPNINIKIFKRVADCVHEFRRIKTDYIFLFKLGLNGVMRFLVHVVEIIFAFRAYHYVLSFSSAGILELSGGLVRTVSITPMNLGFKESALILTSKILNIQVMTSVFVAALQRAIALVWVFIAAPVLAYILLKDFKLGKDTPYPNQKSDV